MIKICINLSLFIFGIQAWAANLPPTHSSDFSYSFQNQQRLVKIYRPEKWGEKPMPVLMLLHGGNGSVEKFQSQTGKEFVEAAIKKGYLLVLPQGTDTSGKNKNHWNDGRKTYLGNKHIAKVDDVAFLVDLNQRLRKSFSGIDATKIYLAGVSNGAMMTMRVACEAPQSFAGFAPMIGSLSKDIADTCVSQIQKPMVFLNGTEDRLVSYDGKDRRPLLLRKKLEGERLTVPQTLDVFAKRNACQGSTTEKLPDTNPKDGSTIEKIDYQCAKKSPLRLYKIIGAGHTLPGMSREIGGFMKRWVGEPNGDLNSVDAIWSFFRSTW